MQVLKNALERYGIMGVVWILAAPVLNVLTVPRSLVGSLRNLYAVRGDKWSEYNRFRAVEGLNSLTYWTQWLGLARYGRNGTSEMYGYGTYHWRDLWNHSMPSIYLYRQLGALSPVVSMGMWWGLHLLWLDFGMPMPWLAAVMALLLFSSTFYCNVFMRQNYNAWGWLFVPVGLYGWYSGQWGLAALAWLGASFGSFTAVFCAGVLSLFMCLETGNAVPVLTMIPGSLKLATHFLPFIRGGGLRASLQTTASAIGAVKREGGVQNRARLNAEDLCFLMAQGALCALAWYGTGRAPVLVLGSMALLLVNTKISRFADRQSMIILGGTTAAATVLALPAEPDWLLLAVFAYVVSPAPKIVHPALGFTGALGVVKPFHVQPVLDALGSFFSPVAKGERVLMVYKESTGGYGEVFGGMKQLNEAAVHVSFAKEFLLMPNWWTVLYAQLGERKIWGDTLDEVVRNMSDWQSDYAVIIAQDGRNEPGAQWDDAGFEVLSFLDWEELDFLFDGHRPYSGSPPRWWLLRRGD